MTSALEKLLFPSTKNEEESDLEVDTMEEEEEEHKTTIKIEKEEKQENESIVKIKEEIFEEKVNSQTGQQLLDEITDFLHGNKSTSSKSIKGESNTVKVETSTVVFGEPRIFKNDRTTWELKPNQMYNPKRDNGTIRGRHLICENATYRNNGTKNNIVYWKCCFTNCKARLSTSVNGDAIFKYPNNHNHRLDGLDAQVLDAKFQLRLATTSEELKQAVENIQAKYPKYVQNKIKTSHITRSNRRRKQKLVKFTFDFDQFKAETKLGTKPSLISQI